MPFRSATHPIVLAQGVPCELRDRLRGGGFVCWTRFDLDYRELARSPAIAQRPLAVGAFARMPA
jgi:hypothetical protein